MSHASTTSVGLPQRAGRQAGRQAGKRDQHPSVPKSPALTVPVVLNGVVGAAREKLGDLGPLVPQLGVLGDDDLLLEQAAAEPATRVSRQSAGMRRTTSAQAPATTLQRHRDQCNAPVAGTPLWLRRAGRSRRTSSAVKGSFLSDGSSWLNQRRRQLLPLRPLPKLCSGGGVGGEGVRCAAEGLPESLVRAARRQGCAAQPWPPHSLPHLCNQAPVLRSVRLHQSMVGGQEQEAGQPGARRTAHFPLPCTQHPTTSG